MALTPSIVSIVTRGQSLQPESVKTVPYSTALTTLRLGLVLDSAMEVAEAGAEVQAVQAGAVVPGRAYQV